MVIKNRIRKTLALFLIAVLAVGAAGCGGGQEKTDGPAKDTTKGRYVESALPLPEGVSADDILQIGKYEGKLFFLEVRKSEEEPYFFTEYIQDGQGSFEKKDCDWLNGLELTEPFWRMNYVKGEGEQAFFFAEYEGDYWGHLFTTTDGQEGFEITPAGWKEAQDMDGYNYYECPDWIGMAASDTLVGGFYDRIEFYHAETGEMLRQMPVSESYLETCVPEKDGYYLFKSSNMRTLTGVERYQNGQNEPVETIAFTEKSSGTMSTYVDVLEDGTVIACTDEGFYRYDTAKGEWEQTIPARFTSLIMETMWCQGIVATDDGALYALFMGEEEQGTAIMQYVYDPEYTMGEEKTLTVYTIYPCSVVKQAAALFQKSHPEVQVIVETELTYDDMYGGTVDLDSIYSSLNAEILAGNAADVLILDGLKTESFIEKGLLLDIDDVITPMEEKGELLSNITKNYRNEDGTRYHIPLRFAMNLLVGRDVEAGSIQDMKSMAEDFAGRQESMLGARTVEDLVYEFAPYFTDEIIREKQLDKEALKRYLEYLKVIADNCGIVDNYGENYRAEGIWEIASTVYAAFYEAGGFNQSMLPVSAAKLVNGSLACFENAYIPEFEIGIYSQTKEEELAKEFLEFALSTQVQDTDFYDGFPINTVSLENQVKKDRSDAEAYTTIVLEDGQSIGFEIRDFDDTQSAELMEMCKKLDRKVVEDKEVNEKLVDSVAGYLDGSRTLDETVDRVEAGLRMYLAE